MLSEVNFFANVQDSDHDLQRPAVSRVDIHLKYYLI